MRAHIYIVQRTIIMSQVLALNAFFPAQPSQTIYYEDAFGDVYKISTHLFTLILKFYRWTSLKLLFWLTEKDKTDQKHQTFILRKIKF